MGADKSANQMPVFPIVQTLFAPAAQAFRVSTVKYQRKSASIGG
jgi:hypothetical protein